ncbi:MAG: hypothetical protein HYY06_15380 [Deltaproteobacteria bacterium]|nr:hypothetical protein [Deltaproteobacteria bacterium]
MVATDLEFRHRFWVIGGIFFVGFGCVFVDPVSMTEAAAWLLGRIWAVPSVTAVRAVIVAGALVVALGAAVRTWAAAYLGDCGSIDADPDRMLDVTLDCYAAGGDIQTCVQAESGGQRWSGNPSPSGCHTARAASTRSTTSSATAPS